LESFEHGYPAASGEADLYEPPLTVFGRNAVERFFTPGEIHELLELAATLAA
jgi:hypothetical protein